MKTILIAAVFALGCGKGDVCKRASTKYEACAAEIVGPELAAKAARNRDIAACEADPTTVRMYTTCLDKSGCNEFLACLDAEANRTTELVVPTYLPRAEQCKQHVADGSRAIADQVVVMNEIEPRNEAAQSAVQRCVLDEHKPWASCITPAERTEVESYGKQRQKECEAWPEKLAACIFRQTTSGCDPNSYPLWQASRPVGEAGPAVVWSSAEVHAAETGHAPLLAWTPDHALVIADALGVRLVRDGKLAWSVEATVRTPLLVGRYVVGMLADEDHGVIVVDVKTGAKTMAFEGKSVAAIGAAGDKVVAQRDNELYEITPSACSKPGCMRKLGAFAESDTFATESITGWRDKLVLLSTTNLRVADRRGKILFELSQSNDAAAIALAGDTIAVTDSKGLALLSLPNCMRTGATLELESAIAVPGACAIAFKAERRLDSVTPVVVPGNALVINGDKTELFGESGGWAIETDGRGPVVGDAKLVYTVALGTDGSRVVAIDRKTGHVAWQTKVANAAQNAEVGLALRDGMLAVRVGDVVYAIALASRPA